ncbi:MAG TPA: outer membrane protein assembly factor BamD [Candidatus Brocadiia bacterium]|nr:outer membrane protein assembly factor BamD [Candidatus Brocadiia bacterium]
MSQKRIRRAGTSQKRLLAAAILLAALSAISPPANAATVWTWETGEVNLDELPRQTPERRLRHAQAMIIAGQCTSAIRELELLIKEKPGEEIIEDARFEIAHALHLRGSYKAAFEAFTEFLDKYRGSRREVEAIREQFEICRDAARNSPGTGIDLYEMLLTAPYVGDYADDCQKGIGDCYFDKKDFEGAWDAYTLVVENYERSIWISYCLFRIPLSRYMAGTRLENDKSLMLKARAGFEEYLTRYPSGAYADEARQHMDELKAWFAQHYIHTARFYFKMGQAVGVARVCKRVISDLPDSPEAVEARQMLDRLISERYIKANDPRIAEDAFEPYPMP